MTAVLVYWTLLYGRFGFSFDMIAWPRHTMNMCNSTFQFNTRGILTKVPDFFSCMNERRFGELPRSRDWDEQVNQFACDIGETRHQASPD